MKHKAITSLAVAIVLLLTISFFIGDSGEVVPLEEEMEKDVAVVELPIPIEESEVRDEKAINNEKQEELNEKKEEHTEQEVEKNNKVEKVTPQQTEKKNHPPQKTEPESSDKIKDAQTEQKKIENKDEIATEQKVEKEKIMAEDNKNKEQKDNYLTDPVPDGKPKPVEWQNVEVDKNEDLTATLTVTAKTILNNMHLFNEDKIEVLPPDGVIYPKQTVTFYEGESVFDVLLREMQDKKIHMEFVMTPIYNSHYIEGINNLYEFDCGELSGWMYKVNGWFPNYGASRYQLEDNDEIEWVYTCDLGRDIGGYGAPTGGAE